MASVVGRPDEANAVFHNPAGLALAGGVRIYASLGVSMIDTQFRLAPWEQSERFIDAPVDEDGYYPAVEPTRAMGVIPMIAITADLWRGKLFGAVSTYVSNGTGAKFEESAVTKYHLVDGYVVSPLVQASIAYKPHRQVAVGASLGVMNIRSKGRRYVYPILDGNDVTQLVGSNPLLELEGSAWKPTWNAGVVYAPARGVTIGASVVGRVDATLRGPLTLTYGDDAFEPGAVLNGEHATGLMLPWTFLAGVNVDVAPTVEIGTEFRYWLYRQYDVQHTDVDGIFFVRELETRKDYRDSWQTSGGVRVHDLPRVPALDLMLGAHYDRTPAPTKSLTLDSPSFSHVGLHTGARYRLGRYQLSLTYIHYWYDVPTITDSMTAPPSNIDGDGENHIVSSSIEASL
jgi:long-subunit fatty acid transport protein